MKRWIWLLALLVLLAGLCPALAEETLGTGACGEGLTWSVTRDNDGLTTLEISGKGAITDNPWRALKDEKGFHYQFDRLVLNEGITAICDNAFSSSVRAGVALTMPSTLKTIGHGAFLGTYPVSLTLNEGLVSIGGDAFDSIHCCPAVVIPGSVTDIGYRALPQTGTLYVYPGSEGEQWCKDWGVACELCDGEPSGRDASMKRLLDAIAAADDVPMRYRQPAIEAVKAMTDLTAAQLDGLADYVTEEYAALRAAMSDNDLSAVEIAGFVSRFHGKMTEIGVTVSWATRYIGDYLGVRLNVTVGGDTQTFDVFRNQDYWYLSRLPQGTTSKYSWRETGKGLVLTGYSGSDVNLTVPATLNGKPVIGVEGGSQSWPSGLINLALPEGMKFIGQYAFSGLKKLVNVTLPDSLEFIYDGAFNQCEKITQITFGTHLKTLGNAFMQTGITSFHLPASLISLGAKLPSVTIDPANTHLKKVDGALYNEETKTLLWAWADEIPESFTVKSGTEVIRNSAFFDMATLKQLVLPSSVVEIGDCAFEGCSELASVTLNEGLKRIDGFAFSNCGKLTVLDLPSTLVELGYSALRGTPITNIWIPKGLFAEPEQQWNLLYMFRGEGGLRQLGWVEISPEHPLYEGNNGMVIEKKTRRLLCVPGKINGTVDVPFNTWAIGESAFEGCADVTGIHIPAGVTAVEVNALSGTGIVNLSFPDSVKSIAYQQGLSKLEKVTIPASVTELGFFDDSGFSRPDKKTEVYGIPGSAAQDLAEYQGWDFVAMGATGITGFQVFSDGKPVAGALTIWQGDVVELYADSDGSNEDAVIWSVQSDDESKKAAQILMRDGARLTVGGGAPGSTTFAVRAADNPAVTCQVTVTVKALGASTPDCAVMPADLKQIAANAMRNTAFRYVYVPDGTTAIGSRAFMDCANLRVVRLPDSMTFVAADAFKGCSDVVIVYGSLDSGVVDALYENTGVRGLISWKYKYPWMPPWLVN